MTLAARNRRRQGYLKFGVNRFCDFRCIPDSFSVAKCTQNSELIVPDTFGLSLGVFLEYTLAAKVPQGAKGATCSWMLWIAQKMKNIVVDRTENETCCCGSRRKFNILMWIAQKMKHIAVDQAENKNCCCWIAHKNEKACLPDLSLGI